MTGAPGITPPPEVVAFGDHRVRDALSAADPQPGWIDPAESTLRDERSREEKLDAIGRLAGGIAHDFNNLLTVILGFGALAAEELPEGSPARASLAEIQSAGQRAAELTRQLLAFGRRQLLRPVVVDPSKLVSSFESRIRHRLGERVEVVTQLSPGLPHVHVDPEQLELAVMNLAVKAGETMPGGGRLTITTRGRPGGDAPEVELIVQDTGPGVDEETKSHLFEPFFAIGPRGSGTGLELAEAHGIVAQSHGRIAVESEIGKGTTFRIFLPAFATPAVSRKRESGGLSTTPGGDETILLVEDDAAVRRMSRHILTSLGYRVIEAPDGVAALETARELAAPLDILVSDLMMPGMHGDELGALLKAERPELRLLYMSGYVEGVRPAVATPESAFLQKPFTPRALAMKVRETLDR